MRRTRQDSLVLWVGAALSCTVLSCADAQHASPDAGVRDVPVLQPCQADPAIPQRTDYAQPGPYAVATMELRFEDPARPIAATDRHRAAPFRTLATTIYYPAAALGTGQAPVAAGGPFPMLMYSHGYSSGRGEAASVARRAASYGYIVVAPDFPLTGLSNSGGSPDVTDVANQPGDVSFLIDQVLSLSNNASHRLARAVDEGRIGALGVSLGGLTTLLVSFHPRFHDPRIKVALPIAALSSFLAEGFYHTRTIPLLLVHGDLDALAHYESNARRAFTRAAPIARLLTVTRGSHAAFGAPFDINQLPLLIASVGAPNADLSNPDGVACGIVGETLRMIGSSFLPGLGGLDDFINADEADLVPCLGDEYTRPAIAPGEQAEIAVRSAVAFFEAHLASSAETRQDGCRYLLHEMPKNPSVVLE